jgi:hypothetical protein
MILSLKGNPSDYVTFLQPKAAGFGHGKEKLQYLLLLQTVCPMVLDEICPYSKSQLV